MKRVFLAVFWVGVFLLFLLPANDPDLGWQLRCGQMFWGGQGFCSENIFTSLMAGYKWANHAWLYQALIYPIFRLLGERGLMIINALLVTGTLGLFYQSLNKWDRLGRLVVVVAVIFLGYGMFGFGIRSQVLGFFFLALVMFLLQKNRISLLPVVMLLWANSHGSFVLGIALMGCVFLYKRRGLIIFLLSILATCINPFGLGLYQEVWRHIGGVDLAKLIAEWVPPPLTMGWLILATGTGAVLYLLMNGLNTWPMVMMVVAMVFLGLRARRNVSEFFLITFFLLSVVRNRFSFKFLKDINIFAFISMVFSILVFIVPQRVSAGERGAEGAVTYLKSQDAKGNVFNRYEWGGYLDWVLPEQKIFVDGRMPAWSTPEGKSPYTIYLETLQNQPGWQETLARYDTEWILISPGTFMDLLLAPDPVKYGWTEKYRDKTAVVYKKA